MRCLKMVSLILFMTLVNCSDGDRIEESVGPSGPYQPIIVKTDRADYIRNEGTVITITNGSDIPVIVGACDGELFYYRDRLVDDAWVVWTHAPCNLDNEVEVVIDAHSAVSDTIVVRKPGKYRFWYSLHNGIDRTTSDTVYSGAFTIH